MLDIEKLSKDTVYDIMTELLYSLNYAGFVLEDWVKTRHPEEFQSHQFRNLYEKIGSYEAKRLFKTLGLSPDGINGLIMLLKYSHWAVFENIELEKVTGTSFSMRTIDCSTQRAAKRQGVNYYDCRVTGLLGRISFLKAVNSEVNVQRIFAPPESRPEDTPSNVSCEWLISLPPAL